MAFDQFKMVSFRFEEESYIEVKSAPLLRPREKGLGNKFETPRAAEHSFGTSL
jgi:hypothetical protein